MCGGPAADRYLIISPPFDLGRRHVLDNCPPLLRLLPQVIDFFLLDLGILRSAPRKNQAAGESEPIIMETRWNVFGIYQ